MRFFICLDKGGKSMDTLKRSKLRIINRSMKTSIDETDQGLLIKQKEYFEI